MNEIDINLFFPTSVADPDAVLSAPSAPFPPVGWPLMRGFADDFNQRPPEAMLLLCLSTVLLAGWASFFGSPDQNCPL
ncbi:hypothetical protein CEXT_40001 [Caerostris extrusa]|uniref:Uncharacterized protein n=1 Tax=Caerostris extrusa TaxID=172846 RepID=A0AAV4MQ33_CAEEX|nr:hypothetical protein CEXT_40001 [Caerostris extrusa]